MHIVVVESPAKCKTIQKYLGKDYRVLASYGHMRDLPSRDGSVRPDEGFAMEYEVNPSSKAHVKALVDAVKKADSLILATDPDREGEAISWHVLELLRNHKAVKEELKVQRVSFSSITKKAVLDAIEHPRDIDMDLVNAQQARRALDYLVGFSLSPVLWRKLPGSKSAGRVQSVALRLVCERESEIEHFQPREYWDITAQLTTPENREFSARLTHVDGKKLDKFDLASEAQAKEVVQKLSTLPYTVQEIEKKQARRNPYAPFTTSTLQQEASRKLGFGASKTMTLAQRLYEGVDLGGETTGLITYMRTDGVTVAPEAIHASRAVIEKKFGAQYVPQSPRMYQSKAKNAQEAHEAIRPTDPSRTPEMVARHLDRDQLRLYELIWKRLIASQMESVVLDQVVADIAAGEYAVLRANGSTIRFDGFYRLYREGRDDQPEDEGEEKTLPPMEEGNALGVKEVLPAQHFTQPPPRYTEASLVKKLEELGIGRPSTYASILSLLQARNYVRLEKKRFVAEDRGRLVSAFLSKFFQRYVEYDFTANLEDELDQIAAGDVEWKKVLERFWKDFSANVEEAKGLTTTQIISELNKALEQVVFPGEGDVEERRKCPECAEGRLSLKVSRYGAFVGCSNYPECRFTRALSAPPSGGENEEGEEGGFETRFLGENEEGKDVSVRKGPYGFYVQLGKTREEKKPRRVALPKTMSPDMVTLAEALSLLSLPREVGIHPETGKKITANIGRFGPYIYHEGKYVSLKDDDVLMVGINRAVALIAEAPGKKGSEPLRVLGTHPEDGTEIAVYDGRYGPYVKYKSVNASLPKSLSAQTIALEEALELIAKKAAKGGSRKAAKKPAKKTAGGKKKTSAAKKK